MTRQALIDQYIRLHGVMRCPPAAAWETTADLRAQREALRQHGDEIASRDHSWRAQNDASARQAGLPERAR